MLIDILDKGENESGFRSLAIVPQSHSITFTPVREEDLSKHKMHHEWFSIPEETLLVIEETHSKGGRVIADRKAHV